MVFNMNGSCFWNSLGCLNFVISADLVFKFSFCDSTWWIPIMQFFVRASACAGWGWCYFRSSYSIADIGNGLFVTHEIAKGLAKGVSILVS